MIRKNILNIFKLFSSTIFCTALFSIVSCNDKDSKLATMSIKDNNGNEIPTSLKLGDSIGINCFDNDNNKIDGVSFYTTTNDVVYIKQTSQYTSIELIGVGQGTVCASASGYETVNINFNVHPLSNKITVKQFKDSLWVTLPQNLNVGDKIKLGVFDQNVQIICGSFETTTPNLIQIDAQGNVTALESGTATLIGHANGYDDVSYQIIIDKNYKQLNIRQKSGQDMPASIKIQETLEIGAFDSDGKNVDNVKFSTFQTAIIEFDPNNNHLLRAKAIGSAEIRAVAIGYDEAVYTIIVTSTSGELEIKQSNGQDLPDAFITGKSIKIGAFDTDHPVTNVKFSVTQSEQIIKFVDEVTIEPLKPGNATIVANATGYPKKTIDIVVQDPQKQMSIKQDDGSDMPATLQLGNTITIATYDHAQKVDNVTFETTTPETISISSTNIIKAIGVGNAKIIAKADDYADAYFSLQTQSITGNITIKLSDGKTLDDIEDYLKIGDKFQIFAYDGDFQLSNVELTTDTPQKIEIDKNKNIVMVKSTGSARIIASAPGYEQSITNFTIPNKKDMRIFKVDGTEFSTMKVGEQVEVAAFEWTINFKWERIEGQISWGVGSGDPLKPIGGPNTFLALSPGNASITCSTTGYNDCELQITITANY